MDNSARFVTKIQRILSCSHGCLPFNYLGVSIFVDAPKCQFLQPLADKVKLKLASWKGKSLSMMGRIQLVNTVITGFLAYIFNMYNISLFNQVEQWCQNFILTGDIMKKGIVTVNWDTICSPLENGGLKIINLRHENNACLLKLIWNFAYRNKPWPFLMKAKVLKSKYEFRMVYRSPSLWPGIKQFYSTILYYTFWSVGTCTFINLWNDNYYLFSKYCTVI